MYFHAAAHDGLGCMYIFGGIEYNEKDVRRRNTLYKMWMTIPKLSEICWEAVTYYNKNLHRFDLQTLQAEGIPEKFIRRLPPLKQKQNPTTERKQVVNDDASTSSSPSSSSQMSQAKRLCTRNQL